MVTYLPKKSTLALTRGRSGRLRGLQALRIVDGLDSATMAADDPIEHSALAALADRAATLARRGFGLRGWRA